MNIPKDKIELANIWEVVGLITDAINHAEAHRTTSERLQDAHEYVKKYCMPGGWGKNVWHTILDDAIRMRKEESIRLQNLMGDENG